MAAGSFKWYTTGLKYLLEGRINLAGGAANGSASTTIVAYPLRDTYTPSTASHSALAQVTAHQCTASGTIVNSIALTTHVTQSGAATVKFDANDVAGFSSDGSTIPSFKYLAFVARSASSGGGVDNLLVGFLNLDTDSTSASVGNTVQVNVTFATAGLGKLRGNP